MGNREQSCRKLCIAFFMPMTHLLFSNRPLKMYLDFMMKVDKLKYDEKNKYNDAKSAIIRLFKKLENIPETRKKSVKNLSENN